MSPVDRAARVLVVAFLAMSPVAATAQVEPPAIIVVDYQRVVRESAAAGAVRAQIDALRISYQEEFARIEEELRALEAELTEQRPVLSDDEFVKRRREFEQRVTEAQREAQYRRAALDRALDVAMDLVQSALLDVIAAVAEEQEADLVLNQADVVMADQDLDFTVASLNRLNEVLPYVDVIVPEQ
ncbi:MAG: OmpH family outer membrane protein [Inquilinus sp.]|nr:OmpH family outer membrane protein [Inquilinus sp.]